jgi:hypothetical protein
MGVKLTYSDKEAVKDIIAKLDFGGEIIWKFIYWHF